MQVLSKNRFVFYGLLIVLLFGMVVTALPIEGTQPQTVNAQGPNLLVNPSFESTWYVKPGVRNQLPTGWDVWSNGQQFTSDRNIFRDEGNPPRILTGNVSWVMRDGFVNWIAGGFQRVTVVQGTTYRFSINGYVWTCNDLVNSCGGGDRVSDTTFGGTVKVGIDPLGGTDPNAASIVWSAPAEAYDAFRVISVDATAQAPQITVFTHTTVARVPGLREVYWEDASLTVTTPAATNVPTVQYVPFVVPQGAQPDGSVVHTVRQGDTFDSILVAYRPLGATRQSILDLNDWDLPPSIILVGDKIKVLPPGSVNPSTGQVLATPATSTGITPSVTPLVPSNNQARPSVTPLVPPSNQTQPTPTGQAPAQQTTPVPSGGGDSRWRPSETINRDADVDKGGSLPSWGSPNVLYRDMHMRLVFLQPSSPTPATGRLCVQFFEDNNRNTRFDSTEPALADGIFSIQDTPYTVASANGLGCLVDIAPGIYTLSLTPPPGYSLQGSTLIRVEMPPTDDITLLVGVKRTTSEENIAPSDPNRDEDEPANSGTDIVIIEKASEEQTVADSLFRYSGFIVLGLSGFLIIVSLMLVRFFR